MLALAAITLRKSRPGSKSKWSKVITMKFTLNRRRVSNTNPNPNPNHNPKRDRSRRRVQVGNSPYSHHAYNALQTVTG